MNDPDRGLDPQLFLASQCRLDEPSGEALREAFTRLPKRGFIELRCAWDRRLELLPILELCGGFAISVMPLAGFRTVRLSAFKGKIGPCYETGRSTTYEGTAAAVLDDDSHLIAGTVRVCEKTGSLHTLPPYHGLLTVSNAQPELLQRLETHPLPFDCSTFDADARRLATQAAATALSPDTDMQIVLYPGPFRLLVLREGTILRRGRCYRLAANVAAALAGSDRLLLVPKALEPEAQMPESYPAAFAVRGPQCLLVEAECGSPVAVSATTTASAGYDRRDAPATLTRTAKIAICACSVDMKQRLQRLIARREPYFILTGSDPAESGGCCPNDLVGEANRLVTAGVLARNRIPAAADACTNTLYALAGEINGTLELPQFCVQDAFRDQVATIVAESLAASGNHPWQTALQLLLVGMLLASVSLAVRRTAQVAGTVSGLGKDSLSTALLSVLRAAPKTTRLVICRFSGDRRCESCDRTRDYCQQTLTKWFSRELADGTLVARDVDTDSPANRSLRQYVPAGTTTIGMVAVRNGLPQNLRLLTREIWQLQNDEDAFCGMLREEIRRALQKAEWQTAQPSG